MTSTSGDPEPEPTTTEERGGGAFPIVGVGASAGGLEAFTQLLSALPTDIGIRDALRLLRHDPAGAAELSERWRPWRSYAQLHLWNTLTRPEEN